MLQSNFLDADLALQALLQSPDGLLVIDAERRVQWRNPKAQTLLGMTGSDAACIDAIGLWPAPDRQAFAEALTAVFDHSDQPPRTLLSSAPGHSNVVEVRLTRLVVEDGSVYVAAACRVFGSTPSLALHPRYREASERLAVVLNNISDPGDLAYAVSEILGSTLQVNRVGYGTIDPALETITIKRDWNAPGIHTLAGTLHFRDYGSYIEDLKRGDTVVFADAYRDPRTAATADALRDVSAVAAVNMPVSEQGGFVALLYLNHAEPREWTEDELAFIAEVAQRTRNAVERRRAEQDLMAMTASLEDQVAARTTERDRMWRLSGDVMLVVDSENRIRSVNPAWTRALGWKDAEVTDRSFLDFVHPDDIEISMGAADQLAQGKKIRLFENRYRHRDGGYRWIAWSAVPGEGLLHAVGRDITDQKEATVALERAEEQLRQAQKMEAIGKLTGGVAHDFNNLLQVIGGNLQLLSTEVSGNRSAERRVANAMEGVTRGSKLAAQLLAFGRRQPLTPKVVNIGRLIRSMDELLRRSLGDAIEVETVVMGGLWNARVDAAQMENALLNLAINARDAMDDRGRLTVEAGNASLDRDYCDTHAEVEPGQYVMIAVTDNGAGMEVQVMERAFEPFFTTKAVGRGTGLGLSMVYGFVKQSGGHIKIYTEAGHGTTVKIYLPRSTHPEDQTIRIDNGPVVGGHETILVAEDNDAVRETVVAMLEELDYRVLKACDASGALSIIDSGTPIDVLFTDVIMPGELKSPELARKARERLPDIAVLFTSGYTENAIVHGGRLDHGVELLTKPYTREALAKRLRQIIGAAGKHAAAPSRSMPANCPVDSGSSAHDRPEATPTPDAGNLRILLCEDEWLIRASVAEMLASRGYEVIEAADATQARKAFEKQPCDLLITDVSLPGESGVELIKALRQIRPDLPVLFATGRSPDESLASDPHSGFVSKPYGVSELERAIAKLVPSGRVAQS